MPFVLTDEGLQTETFVECKAAFDARLRAFCGEDIDTDAIDEAVFAQISFCVTEFLVAYQQVVLQVYRSFMRSGASGVSLNRVGDLTGSRRRGEENSTRMMRIKVTEGSTLPNGYIMRDKGGSEWEVFGGPYELLDGFPTEFQEGIALVALEPGPITSLGSYVCVSTPEIPGFVSASSNTPVILGRLQESDVAFRTRQVQELYSQGNGPLATIEAIVSRARSIDGGYVQSVRAYHNPATSPVDANGIPFKAFNVVAATSPSPPSLALQDAICEAIYACLGAGGYAYATGDGFVRSVVDAEGFGNPVGFDIVVDVIIDINYTITTSTSEVTSVPDQTIKDTIKAAALALIEREKHSKPGRDVLAWQYAAVVGPLAIPGIDNVECTVAEHGDLGTSKLSMGIYQRPTFVLGNISVDIA